MKVQRDLRGKVIILHLEKSPRYGSKRPKILENMMLNKARFLRLSPHAFFQAPSILLY